MIFPKWMNALPTVFAVGALGGLLTAVGGFWYWATPEFWEVGYMPTQPGGGFNHQIHAGMLGMDCRYCHTKVEVSPEANVPNVATCMGCHQQGKLSPTVFPPERDAKVEFIRTAYAENESVEWRRIHKLPDYVRNFPHNVHVDAGVSCYSCHGQIMGMPVVYQAESLSMAWCLDCHRKVRDAAAGEGGDLGQYLVPKDRVTQLQWVQDEWLARPDLRAQHAEALLASLKGDPPQNCGACHY